MPFLTWTFYVQDTRLHKNMAMKKLYAKIGKAYDIRTEPYYTLVLKYKYLPGDVK